MYAYRSLTVLISVTVVLSTTNAPYLDGPDVLNSMLDHLMLRLTYFSTVT